MPTRSDAQSLRKATLLSTAALLAGLLPFSAQGQTIPSSTCPSDVDATTCFAGSYTNQYILQQSFSGGSFNTYTSANISIVNDLSIQNPITITSFGSAGGSEVGESGAAGDGGSAGSVELVNDGELSWTGNETGTNADNEIEIIYAVADGGEGGHPDEHGDGGVGGNGGFMEITNNETIQVSGSFAAGVQGIHAFAAGGAGGPGNDSSINHHGGNGGAGGTINQIQNNGDILLGTTTQSISGNGNAIAIYARSAGGNGGANGYSNGGGSHSGNGGGGAAVVVENNDDIVINWDSADGVADTLVGIQAISQGGNGAASAHNFESGGLGGSSGNVTVQNYGDITVISQDNLSTGGGIVVQSNGGEGGDGQKQGSSGTDGIAGNGGDAEEVFVFHNDDAVISTQGYELPGIIAVSRGGAGGSGVSGYDESNSSGGNGGVGGSTTIGLTGTASIHTTGDLSPGVLAQGIGGYGGNGGNDGGLVGEVGGAGEGGDGGDISLSSSSGNDVITEGEFSYGMAAQSIGGGGGTGGDFYGVLGGAGGAGGRGGDAKTATVTADGRITTSGDHAYAILAQSIAGGGGAGGIAVGVVALGGDGGAGGTGGSATVTNNANISTSGYAAHGILAQSIGGGGGAAGVAGGVLSIGGDGAASYTANGGGVTVTQSGNVTTSGAAAIAVMAQSIGGGGGSGAGGAGIGVIGGTGSAGGAGGTVQVTLNGESTGGGSINTGGDYAHALLAQSIGGGGGNGGDAIDLSVGIPSFGVGGGSAGGGEGGEVDVTFAESFIFTQGDHAAGIIAQSLGGGGGNGGDATGASVLSAIQLNIGGNAGGGGNGNTVTVTGTPDNIGIVTFGAFSHGVVAQSIGGGGGNGGNAYGFDATLNFAAQVAVGGKAGAGGHGSAVTVDWEGSVIQTGDIDNTPPPGQPVSTTGQAGNAYGILAQSIGGGGGNGGSATIDQFVFSIPDGDIPIPTITLGATVGGASGSGGAGETVNVTFSAFMQTVGAGSHGIVMQSIGGGGGTGGDATMLGVVGAIPKTTSLPSVDLKLALGASGGTGGNAGSVNFTLGASSGGADIETWGDNANAIVAQAIGGGGGDAGAGNSSTYELGEPFSVTARFTLGGTGGSGGTGGAIVIDMAGRTAITTLGAGSRGIVAQSIGGGGGTSQGGTGALGAGSFSAIVEVGRQGGGGSDGNTITLTNIATINTYGGDADGILAQSIGGGGGLGGTFAADGSLDDPNWVYLISNTVKEIKEIAGDASYSGTIAVGGAGGTAGAGKTVTATNEGTIVTRGDWADGIVLQSIGGGGGSGGSAMAYGVQQTVAVNVGVGGKGGQGGAGGEVNLNAPGTVQTFGYGAYGVLLQAIGGGGGQGGDGSTNANGTITVGSGAGGSGGTGGDGGGINLTGGGTVVTSGDDAHAVVLQSVGGGGGTGGQGNSQSANFLLDRAFDIIVGGSGGTSGSGQGAVIYLEDLSDNFQIQTSGARSFGIVVQSIGGGGGIGGAGASAGITSVVIGGHGGGTQDANSAYVSINDSTILTSGIGAIGIIAQSIGGGGGIGGDASGAPLTLGGTTSAGVGNGGLTTVLITGTIVTSGDYAHGIVAQSIAGGGGFGGDKNGAYAGSNATGNTSGSTRGVDVDATTVQATGLNAIGIFAQSDSGGGTDGGVNITVRGTVLGGSGTQGAGVHVDQGNSTNLLTITADGSVTATSGSAVVYTGTATLNVDNEGTTQANVDLRSDLDVLGLFNNKSGSRLFAGTLIDADLDNRGLFVVGLGNGGLETTVVGGDFTQFAEGKTKIDADLAANVADVVEVKGQAVLDGDMSFNFLNLLPNGEALVLTADGGIAGALNPAGSGIFDFALTQQGNELHLSVGGADFQTDGLPASQAAVAGHLQSIWDAGGNEDFGAVFASIENAAANGGYEDVLSDLSPGVALAPAARSGPAAQIFTNSLLSCPVFEGDGASLTEGACGWARVAGRITDQSENDGVAGFNNSRVTYQAGGQAEVADDWFVGGSLAYEMSWFSGDDDRVTSDGDAVFVGAAVKHTMDAWLFAASVGGGFGWYDTQRAVGMTGDVAKSSPDVQSVAGRLRAAYTLDQDSWYLRPIADLELIYVRAPGYEEHGAGALDLEYDDAEQVTFAFSPALEVGGRVELGSGFVLRPFGLVGVSVLSNDDWDVSTRFAGAPGGTDSFETSLPLDQVIGRVSAGVQLMAAEGFDLRLTYDGEFSSHITSHAGALTVAVPF